MHISEKFNENFWSKDSIFFLFFFRNFHFIIYILKNLGHYRGDQLKVIKKKNLKKRKIEQTFHSVQFVHSVHFTYIVHVYLPVHV